MPEQLAQADPTVMFVLMTLLPTIVGVAAALIGWVNRKGLSEVRRDTRETAERGRAEREKREANGGDGCRYRNDGRNDEA